MFLRFESPAWPCHFAGLAVVDGKALVDEAGRLRLAELTDRTSRRLASVPELRRRLHVPGFPKGGPLWVDDDRFDIRKHIHQAAAEPPGCEAELLELAARLDERQLDRARPLWELWFLTGLCDGRVGVLLKLHHCVADGLAAVALMGSLFDVESDEGDPDPAPWTPEPIPGGWSLLIDNFARKTRTALQAAAMLAHPRQLAQALGVLATVVRQTFGEHAGPPTSLNRPVLSGRRVRFLQLDLAAVKRAARAHHGTVNDVVLDLWTGGLRELLMTRGELVPGVELVGSQAVSLRSRSDRSIDNQVGAIMLPLPVCEPDPQRRLDAMVQTDHRRDVRALSALTMRILAGLSAFPIARSGSRRQRAVNVRISTIYGPRRPAYIFGARVLQILPIVRLFGNVGLALCAFSYVGQICLVVTADAARFPDLDTLMGGMEQDWRALVDSPVPEAVPA
jgi:WS/DGAT/MGAT family acyltransferase